MAWDALESVGDFVGDLFENNGPGLSTGAALGLGGAQVIAALLGADAAKAAAGVQSRAADSAATNQLQMFEKVRGDLLPFQLAGLSAINPLAIMTGTQAGGNPLTAPLTRPFMPTMEDLEKSPGYQFTLKQGLKAVTNKFTAQGLGGQSGALGKGLADYATNLASTTYSDRFKENLAQNQQIYNMLSGLIQGGQNAATGVGNFGTQAATTAGNLLTSGAAATAGGIVGAANAAGGGIGNVSNLLLANSLLKSMPGMYGRG